jgi:threonine dehydrogenase-like Zn-dependent dehydrogenase
MKSLTCRGDGRVALVDVSDPEPGSGDALVRIAASAVCGSERSSYVGGMDGNTGHEAAGVLEAVPEGHGFAPGERVGMSAVFGCGACARCARGQEMHCEDGPRINAGWHAEYAVVPVRTLRAIPQDLDLGLAAMMTGDPLGVPARALGRAPAAAGTTVVVVGLGPVGLGHTLVRAFAGCRVIGIEPSPQRRALALALGAAEAHAPGDWVGGRRS